MSLPTEAPLKSQQSSSPVCVDPAVYSPVSSLQQEIRLLVVQSARVSGDGPIQCGLIHISLDDRNRPSFEAVSYVWGDTSKRATILVSEYSCDVPASAERVIRRFRSQNMSRLLWIDAVCINQSDTREKSAQVMMMDRIYASASQCLIWLGESNDDTHDEVESCKTLVSATLSHDDWLYTTDVKKVLSKLPSGFDELGDLSVQLLHTTRALKLLNRHWFKRVWVVQEFALAPRTKVFCGNFELELLELLRCAYCLGRRHTPVFTHYSVRDLMHLIKMWTLVEPARVEGRARCFRQLKDMLVLGSEMLATDERDKVFAVLGLIQDRMLGVFTLSGGQTLDMKWIEPDYDKSLKEVSQDATRFVVTYERNLDMFGLIRYEPGTDLEGLSQASWAVSLQKGLQIDKCYMPLTYVRASGLPRYSADARLSFRMPMPPLQRDIFHVYGYHIGTIVEMTKEFADAEYPEDLGRGMRSAIEEASQFYRKHEASIREPHVPLAAILVAESHCSIPAPIEEICSAEAAYRDWVEAYDKAKELEALGLCEDEAEAILLEDRGRPIPNQLGSDYLISMHYTLGRRVFITDSGYIGLGPSAMLSGDVVVILQGGMWPFVLRTSGEKHRLVGHCYVAGAMFGEAVAHAFQQGLSPQLYSLA